MGVALVAWLFHVAALALAPISLVQAVISGGLVFLAVLADRWFGFSLGRASGSASGSPRLGLAFLGLTVEHGSSGSHSSYSISGMIAFEAAHDHASGRCSCSPTGSSGCATAAA